MVRRNYKLLLICAVAYLFFCMTGQNVVYAADDEDYGPIDAYALVKENILKMDKTIKDKITEQENADDTGFMGRAISANKWIVTRALVQGMDNVEQAIALINGDSTLLKDLLLSYLYAIEYFEKDKPEAKELVENMTPEEVEAKLREYGLYVGEDGTYQSSSGINIDNDYQSSIGFIPSKASNFLQFRNLLIESRAFLVDKPIYDRMKVAAVYLLFLFMVIRLGFCMYRIVVGNDGRGMHDLFSVVTKTGLIFILLFQLKNVIFGGIQMSDALRDMISGHEDIGALVLQMLKAKIELLGISTNTGFIGIIKSGMSVAITTIFSLLCYYIAGSTLYILMLLADIMMGITAIVGPLVFALSLLPSCEGYIGKWVRGYITFLLYSPLATIYAYILLALLAVGLDTSPLIFIVICIAYIMGATRVPNIAESLSGVVLTGMAIGIAMAPVNATKNLASGGLSMAGGKLATAARSTLTKGD